MHSKNTDDLIKQLQYSKYNWRLRQKIVQNLQELAEEAKSALPKLYQLVENSSEDSNVRKTALDAVLQIENNSKLLPKLIEWLNREGEKEYFIQYAAAIALGGSRFQSFFASKPQEKETLKQLKDKLGKEKTLSIQLSLQKTIAKIENKPLDIQEFVHLIENGKTNDKQVAAKELGFLGETAKDTLPKLEEILEKEKIETVRFYIQIAIDQIKQISLILTLLKYLKTNDVEVLNLVLIEFNKLEIDLNDTELLNLLDDLLNVLMELLEQNLSNSKRCLKILEIIVKILGDNAQKLATILIKVLDKNQIDLDVKARVALEFELIVPEMSLSTVQTVLQKLKKLDHEGSSKQEIKYTVKAIEAMIKDKQIGQTELLLKSLKEGISLQEKTDCIKVIVEQAYSHDPLRLLLKEWIDWIAEEKETFLVEITAGFLRQQKLTVLPLVSLLEHEWQPTETLREEISQQANREVLEMGGQQQDKDFDSRVKEKVAEQINRRRRIIDKKIFQLISEMSDGKFIKRYKDDPAHEKYEHLYLEIKDEISKYATPILARRLVDESNSTICELITLTLANNGGFYATNALASRSRYDRKELLTKYYLEPSKKQSEDAAEILKSTVRSAQTTLKIHQFLNASMFGVGLVLLTMSLTVGMRSRDNTQRIAAALAGIGGLGGVVFHLVNKPLERIQNSMADLVQAETAFTSYIWELNLNSAFIQSQYMECGVLSDAEINQTVNRIQTITDLTLKRVETHLEYKEQPGKFNTDDSKASPIEEMVRTMLNRIT